MWGCYWKVMQLLTILLNKPEINKLTANILGFVVGI